MILWRVEAGYTHRCGSEYFTFVVDAETQEEAEDKARVALQKKEKSLMGDNYSYESEPLEFDEGVVMMHHDWWEG